jgi:hypothetical protein
MKTPKENTMDQTREPMTAEQAAEWGKTLDFPTVWAGIQRLERLMEESKLENDRLMRESQEKHDRLMAESKAEDKRRKEENDRQTQEMKRAMEKTHEETERALRKSLDEMAKSVKDLSVQIGGVNNSLGDMAEGLMASALLNTFDALGLEFEDAFQNYPVKEKGTKKLLAEVDALLVNGSIAMAVEVKTTLTRGDIDNHLERMEIIRKNPNSLLANRKLFGATAGVKISIHSRNYALSKGFFVIELSGNTVKVDMPEGFNPKTW